MSFYGTATNTTSVIDRAVSSADPADLEARIARMLAALPAAHRVLSAELAGSGDGDEFVFAITAAPTALSEAGLDPAGILVQAFSFSSIQEFSANEALARATLVSAVGGTGFSVDALYAGASQGTVFFGVLMRSAAPPAFVSLSGNSQPQEILRFGYNGDINDAQVLMSPGIDHASIAVAAAGLIEAAQLVTSPGGGVITRLGVRHAPGDNAAAPQYQVALNGVAVVGATVSIAGNVGTYTESALLAIPVVAGDRVQIFKNVYTGAAVRPTEPRAIVRIVPTLIP